MAQTRFCGDPEPSGGGCLPVQLDPPANLDKQSQEGRAVTLLLLDNTCFFSPQIMSFLDMFLSCRRNYRLTAKEEGMVSPLHRSGSEGKPGGDTVPPAPPPLSPTHTQESGSVPEECLALPGQCRRDPGRNGAGLKGRGRARSRNGARRGPGRR